MIHRPFSTAMVDLLMCTVVLLMLLINPPKMADVEEQSKFRLTMSWSDDVDVDMDQFLQLPTGGVVWFGWKDHGWVYSTRDDLGSSYGVSNREEILLENPMPGQYCATIFNYSTGQISGRASVPKGDVILMLTDENGKVRKTKQVPMPGFKEETLMFCFELNDKSQFVRHWSNHNYLYSSGKAERDPNAVPTDPRPNRSSRGGGL